MKVLVRRRDDRSAALEALGAESVIGDLRDRASLLAAFDGVGAATFTFPVGPGIVEAAAAFASAARESGTPPRIVVLSMAPAQPQSPSPLGRAQWLAEEVFAWAGLEPIILRVAAFFFENILLLHRHSIEAEGVIRNNFGEARLPWIGATDTADLMAEAILHPDRFLGPKVQYPPGATLLSHAQIAATLAEILRGSVRYEAVSADAWRQELLRLAENPSTGINADMANHITALAGALSRPEASPVRMPDPAELERLVEHEPQSFEAFLRTAFKDRPDQHNAALAVAQARPRPS